MHGVGVGLVGHTGNDVLGPPDLDPQPSVEGREFLVESVESVEERRSPKRPGGVEQRRFEHDQRDRLVGVAGGRPGGVVGET